MAGEHTTATPPANSGGTDVNAAIVAALKPVTETLSAIAQNQKVLADTMAAQSSPQAQPTQPAQPTQQSKPGAGAGVGVTLEDVNKAIADGFKTFQQQQQVNQQREQFVQQNLGKLPDAYKRQLGDDPAKWGDEAKAIQSAFETDFKAAGGKPETIGGATRDGGTPAGQLPVDTSKLSGYELLGVAMEKQTPASPGPAGPASALTPEAVHAAAANTAIAVGAGGVGGVGGAGDARTQPLSPLSPTA